jgi:hypothetical protein
MAEHRVETEYPRIFRRLVNEMRVEYFFGNCFSHNGSCYPPASITEPDIFDKRPHRPPRYFLKRFNKARAELAGGKGA